MEGVSKLIMVTITQTEASGTDSLRRPKISHYLAPQAGGVEPSGKRAG